MFSIFILFIYSLLFRDFITSHVLLLLYHLLLLLSCLNISMPFIYSIYSLVSAMEPPSQRISHKYTCTPVVTINILNLESSSERNMVTFATSKSINQRPISYKQTLQSTIQTSYCSCVHIFLPCNKEPQISRLVNMAKLLTSSLILFHCLTYLTMFSEHF